MDKTSKTLLWILILTLLCTSKYTCKAVSKVQCPAQCTCTALPYEGLKTNCSGLPSTVVHEALKGISPDTHYL